MERPETRVKRRWRPASRPGQLILPALFIVPSLLLFVYLLFETTKVSREKMRQQFAVDSAAFIQMGDYTNLFNRTAYVNGAFPYRIFKEAYDCPGADGTNSPFEYESGGNKICAFKILYEAGAFPKHTGDAEGSPPSSLDGEKKWEIEFYEPARPDINKNPAVIEQAPSVRNKGSEPTGPTTLQLVTWQQGNDIRIPFTSSAGYFQFYAQVYSLLGEVERSQWTVFQRLTENFNFFRKSYYLNANTQACVDNPLACGNDGVSTGFMPGKLSEGSSFVLHYILKIVFYGKFDNPSNPYDFGGSLGRSRDSDPATDMTKLYSDGLFQLATVDSNKLRDFGKGLNVYQGWDPPSNYFNINVGALVKCGTPGVTKPCVHSLVTTQCPLLNSHGNNCVWPNPTPKYQTRLYP